MRKQQLLILLLNVIGFTMLSTNYVSAQCPANAADLANGGTFSGTCSVDITGSVTITFGKDGQVKSDSKITL